MRTTAVVALLLVLGVGSASAQEREARDEQGSARRARKIRVLEDPYDIASFYRSSQGGGYFDTASSRYPIASFYRAGGGVSPDGYSRFWTSGYSARNRAGVAFGYRRTIGENGDLYLLAPTFLAPVGPLTDVFLGER